MSLSAFAVSKDTMSQENELGINKNRKRGVIIDVLLAFE